MANPGGFEAIKARSGPKPGDLQMMAEQIEKMISQSEESEKTEKSSPQKQQVAALLSEMLPLLNTVINKNNSTQKV